MEAVTHKDIGVNITFLTESLLLPVNSGWPLIMTTERKRTDHLKFYFQTAPIMPTLKHYEYLSLHF